MIKTLKYLLKFYSIPDDFDIFYSYWSGNPQGRIQAGVERDGVHYVSHTKNLRSTTREKWIYYLNKLDDKEIITAVLKIIEDTIKEEKTRNVAEAG